MVEQNPAAGPDVALLGGVGTGAMLRRWLLATRPMFLTASMLPVFVGVAWGFSVSGNFDALATVLAFFATICVHAASNVYNDVGDDYNGTDRINTDRIYPFTGGSQFIPSGLMSVKEMRNLAVGLYAIATVLGIWLTVIKGFPVLIFGALGVAAGVLYSLPRVMLSSR
ncbi:MAG: prenyltransferase, partial [Pseudomonadales bacterium]|nr:prenyltransferase [Pseudomonadales bacterium]